jgi:ABC-type dipeptide/oligopeptide/nickel transport system permease component
MLPAAPARERGGLRTSVSPWSTLSAEESKPASVATQKNHASKASSGWIPLSHDVGEHFRHLLMPALTLGVTQAAILARLLRGALLDIIRTEYITTARAKGVYEWWVIVKHALRNALIPIVTMLGLQLGLLLSSAVVVETFFAVPGLGRYGMEAIVERDYPKIQGFILFIALVVAVTNLVVDLLYMLLDPRIRYTSEH